jgi:YHS domain-containing protein
MLFAKNDWDPKGLWAPYVPHGANVCVVTGEPAKSTVTYQAHTYSVCCNDCRDAFNQNPEKYIAPWDLRRAVHLHRRAGFAATWGELQRDLKDGPANSIDRLLKGQSREGVADSFRTVAEQMAERVPSGAGPQIGAGVIYPGDPALLKAWWAYLMYAGPDPLGERLTLLWHNHFATSNDKVRDTAAMRRQNELIREHARGPFGKLLQAVVHDPALLIWLDAPANRKGQANENLGRELMELFTLGVGRYTESDVKEAARALTGWQVSRGAFRAWAPDHDDGEKTILGKKGRWTGDDLVRFLLEHPATSKRLAWRLCEWLMGEQVVDDSAVDALAAGLRQHDLEMAWGVETVLRSRAFFAEGNLGNRVLGPVEYLIGVPRALECFDPPPSSVVLAEWLPRLGQDLFYPPNVGGWTGGREWLTSQAIIGRANYASALVRGQLSARPAPLDGIALAKRHGRGRDLEDVFTFCTELLTGAPPDTAWRKRLLRTLGPKAKLDPETVRAGIALIIASPEVQMA